MLKKPRISAVGGNGKQVDAPKIKGKPYQILEVWYSVQHPAGPPLVIVRTEEQETQP